MDPAQFGLVHVSAPPRIGGATRHPALLLLHGRGANELDLLPLAEELPPQFYVVSVRAPGHAGSGFAWYESVQLSGPEAASFKQTVEKLTGFIGAMLQAYPIDPTRIFTLGFSQGSVMAGSLLLTQPALVRGTVMLSGYLPLQSLDPPDESKLSGESVFVGHGIQDQVISVDSGREARDFFTRVGADLTYREYPMAHQISLPEIREIRAWLEERLAH